jgi:uncharacterized SAM-binding protein YcdF (DUF218 family)
LYAWVLPPGIFLLAILLAYILCRKSKNARWLLYVFALVYLLSIRAVSDFIIKPLENAYPQPAVSEIKDAQAIVVLAGGSYDGVPDFDGAGQNSESSTVRLTTGLRLYRVLHLPIVYSGGRIHDYRDTEANIGYRFLKACGVEEKDLIKEDRSRNTAENAKFTKEICSQHHFEKVILVTSASHMPRSVAFFEREGMNVIPYPTDYKTDKKPVLNAFAFTPSADCVYNVAIATKEYLGLLAAKQGWQ